jgi:AraC family transcriptional regulator
MANRILGIDKQSGQAVPIGADKVLLSSTDRNEYWQQIAVEHTVFDDVDRPEMLITQPYVALVIGEPLLVWRHNNTWRQHKFQSGQLSIVQAGYGGPFQSADGCEIILASIPLEVLRRTAVEMALPESLELVTDMAADSEILRQLMLMLRKEVEDGYPGGPILHESLETALCAYLLANCSTDSRNAQSRQTVRHRLSKQMFQRVHNYIIDHIAYDISLAELAQIAFLSRYHFSRMFKNAIGISPYCYVLRTRVNKAADIMRSGVSDLNQISQMVGFQNMSALNRNFTKVMGEKPTAYLSRFRK